VKPSTSRDLGPNKTLLRNNPFSPLSVSDEETTPKESKEEAPPPIYVKNVDDFILFLRQLTAALGEHEFTCKSRSQDIMIKTETSLGYRLAVQYLKSMNAQFHTYQLKEERSLRVVIRHIHSSTPTSIIKEELEALNFTVKSVTPVLHPTTKAKLHLFFVDLEPTKKNEEIYDLNRLLRTVIKVEEPHKKREIVQCKRCQQYGHSKSYCNYHPQCVKCAENHPTSECTKTRDIPAKCALCNGQHPASYKGCTVYKQLRQRTQQPTKHTQRKPPPQLESTANFPALQHQETNPPLHSNEESDTNAQPSYASVAGHRRQPSQVPPFIPPPSPSSDLTSLFTSFFSELKKFFQPLISLLATALSAFAPSIPKIDP